jgi:Methyltransferase domain
LIQVDRCVICGGAFRRQGRGFVTPFVAQRIWQRQPFPVRLSECAECGFMFFNPRLEASEEMGLYSGYRSPEYQKMRKSFEPWYTEKFNAGLSSPAAWQHRKQLLSSLFRDRLSLSGHTFCNVLDFGGDRGDLITGLVPASRRFVYEISGVDPVDGVEPLRSLEECRQNQFDLIVTSNVLEHVGSPCDVVAQISSIANSSTLVFNEVPYESVTDFRTRLKRVVQAVVLAATHPTLAWRVIRPGMFNLMHEHVNYFTPRSLDRLMEVSGFKVLDSGDYASSEGLLGERVVWNLAQKL